MVRIIKSIFDTKGNRHICEVVDYIGAKHITRDMYKFAKEDIKWIAEYHKSDYKILFTVAEFFVNGKDVIDIFYDNVIGYHDGKRKF